MSSIVGHGKPALPPLKYEPGPPPPLSLIIDPQASKSAGPWPVLRTYLASLSRPDADQILSRGRPQLIRHT